MGTPNSQERKDTVVSLTDKVAIIAGLKKVGCDELSPQEWLDLFRVVLVWCKPDMSYLSMFKYPFREDPINCFFVKSKDTPYPDEMIHWMLTKYQVSEQMKDMPKIKALSGTKIIEVCRMQLTDAIESVLLTEAGAICIAKFFNSKNLMSIFDVDILGDDSEIIEFLRIYPQIGPSLVFAFISMYRVTLAEKRRHIASLERRSIFLDCVRDKIQAEGHTVFHYPWGANDGKTSVFPEWKPI